MAKYVQPDQVQMLDSTDLETLSEAAIGMLDSFIDVPLLDGADHHLVDQWAADFADRVDICANRAGTVGLPQFRATAHQLAGAFRQATWSDEQTIEAEQWVACAIAFCSGQMGAAHVSQLLDTASTWLDRSLVNLEQLGREAQRLIQVDINLVDRPVRVARDELHMLAQACSDLRIECGLTDAAGAVVQNLPVEILAERIQQIADAVGHIELTPLASLFREIAARLNDAQLGLLALNSEHLVGVGQWPSLWQAWFLDPGAAALEQALAIHELALWHNPSLLERVRDCLNDLEIIQSRQVAVGALSTAADALSLDVPLQSDPDVVEHLLRELPPLAEQLTEAIADIGNGRTQRLADARRIAHTIKGAANTVGVQGVANLTHALEDLLDLVQARDSSLSGGVIDLLLDSADCLAEMVDALIGLGPAPASAEDLYNDLRIMITGLAEQNWRAEAPADQPEILDEGIASTETSDDEYEYEHDDEYDGEEAMGLPDSVADMPALDISDFDLPDLDLPDLSGPGPTDTASSPVGEPDDLIGGESRVEPQPVDAKPDTASATLAARPEPSETPARVDEPSFDSPDAEHGADAVILTRDDYVDAPAQPDEHNPDGILRVPASVIENLLETANQAVVTLAQLQAVLGHLDQTRASMRGGVAQLTDLAGELDRLVDAERPEARSDGRQAEGLDSLEMAHYSEMNTVARRISEAGADGRFIEQEVNRDALRLRELAGQLERVQAQIRDDALRARMIKADSIGARLQRVARQAARICAKPVRLDIVGGDTLIDGELLQRLIEPLAHIIRNAIDHGIEAERNRELLGKPAEGKIRLSFEQQASILDISITDDGAGLDVEAIAARAESLALIPAGSTLSESSAAQLILAPGFSTRENPTQISGRGIGLDVVSQAMRQARAKLSIESIAGQGAQVTLRVPVQLTALPVFVVRCETHVLALSVRGVRQLVPATQLRDTELGGMRIESDGRLCEVRRLEDVLGLPTGILADTQSDAPVGEVVLMVETSGRETVGILAPELGQTRQVVVRGLPPYVPRIPGVDGVALLGDGAIASVLDLPELLSTTAGASLDPRPLPVEVVPLPSVLIVDDSVSVRRTMANFVADLGLVAQTAHDGFDALSKIARQLPALVLVDLEMPGMNGLELTRALRASPETVDLPIVMISSRQSSKHQKLAADAGVNQFMTKPYSEAALTSAIVGYVSSDTRMR